MLKLIWCEYQKMKRSKMLLIGVLATLIAPFFVVTRDVVRSVSQPGRPISLFGFYDDSMVFLMLLIGSLP